MHRLWSRLPCCEETAGLNAITQLLHLITLLSTFDPDFSNLTICLLASLKKMDQYRAHHQQCITWTAPQSMQAPSPRDVELTFLFLTFFDSPSALKGIHQALSIRISFGFYFLTRQHIGAVDDYGENNNDDDNDYGDDGIDEHNDDLYIIGRFSLSVTKNHHFLEQVCLSVCNVFPHFLKSRK